MKTLLVIIGLLTTISVASAQDVKTQRIAWTVSGLKDLRTESVSDYHCVFETNGIRTIKWKQQGGNFIHNFNVDGIDGDWTNVLQDGTVVFRISDSDTNGTLTFQRTATGSSIMIDLSQPTGPRLQHRYTVTETKSLN